MTIRRRPSHVRPRPPASERVRAAVRATPRQDAMRRYRPIRTRRSIPLAARVVMLVAAVGLGAAMLLVGTGVAGRAFAGFGQAIGDAMSHISINSSQGPRSSAVVETNTPVFDQPDNDGYTKQSKVTLTGNVPSAVVGKTGYLVRIYSLQTDGKRLRYQDVPVSGTVRFEVADVPLNQGANTFVATLVAPGGEGAESRPVTYNLDTTPPPLTVSSPANKATITAGTVAVTGTTEAGASISVTNGQTPGTGDSLAGTDGKFSVTVALLAGDNALTISATDVAGNTTTKTLTVHRSLGKLSASLTATPNKIVAHISTGLSVTVRATASDGSPLVNAKVVFSVQVSGVPPIQSPELTTNNTGQASWSTTIQDAWPGSGFVTAVVTTPQDGDVTGSTPVTVVAH